MPSLLRRSLKCLQWNCRSLNSVKKSELVNYVRCNRIDVFALSETWLPPSVVLEVPGYVVISRSRTTSSRNGVFYGGVLLGVKAEIFCQSIVVSSDVWEICGCTVRLADKLVDVFSVYVPPGATRISTGFDSAVATSDNHRLFLGDFNAHSAVWGCGFTDERGRQVIDRLQQFGLVVLNDGSPTRLSNDGSRLSAIDLSICSQSLALDFDWRTLPDSMGSDHLPILLGLNSCNVVSNPRERVDRFRGVDKQLFRCGVEQMLSSSRSSDDDYQTFIRVVSTCARSSKSADRPRVPVHDHKPWWNERCTNAVRARSDATRAFLRKRIRTREDYELLRRAELDAHNVLRRQKRDSWIRHVSTIGCLTPEAQLWNLARAYCGKRPAQRVPNSELLSRQILDRLAVTYVPSSFQQQELYEDECISMDFEFDELEYALASVGHTAVGVDGISYELLQCLPQSAKTALLSVYNRILSSELDPPRSWFDSVVIAVLKPGKDANNADSYRPISLLSCVRKLFEKMVCRRLNWWLEKNNVLSDFQFGFREGRSTMDALSVLHADVLGTYARREFLLALFADVKGAFDNVRIEVLCDKMRRLGIDPKIVSIVWKLTSERRIWLDGQRHFGERNCYVGVPQGSGLSPTLFNIYVSDLSDFLPQSVRCIGYADDEMIYCMGNDLGVLKDVIEDAGSGLVRWCSANGFELSSSKSEAALFTRKYKIPSLSVNLGGVGLPIRDSVKYLGVILDMRMTWRRHTEYSVGKARRRVNFMRSVAGKSWGCHPQVQMSLYKTLVRSVLEYGSFMFLDIAQTYATKLDRVQWAALRAALGTFPSSPNCAVEVLAAIEPLAVRVKLLAARFLLAKVVHSAHPADVLLRSLWSRDAFGLVVLHKRLYDLCGGLDVSRQRDSGLMDSLYRPDVNTAFRGNLDSPSPVVTNCRFLQYLEDNYPGYDVVYTDGSRSDCCTGAAFVHGQCEEVVRLPQFTSVYVAEFTALFRAVEHMRHHPPVDFVIASDSRSCLERLGSRGLRSDDPVVLSRVRESLASLGADGYRTALVWCPAHCGVTGNERADVLAKRALELDWTLECAVDRCSVLSLFRAELRDEWQRMWTGNENGRFTYSIFPVISSRPWFCGRRLPRSVIVTVSRILLNHHCLNAHLSRFGIVPSPLCDCGDQYQTVDHVLWGCRLRREGRDGLVECFVNSGIVTGDIRYILTLDAVPTDCLIRIHTFLRRHDVQL